MYAVVVALVPLLLERGYTTSQAAWALGLGGAGQTLGRTLYARLARHTTATARTTVLIGLGGLTTAAFATVPGPYALIIAISIAAGMVRGNLTLLQATAATDRWGTTLCAGHPPTKRHTNMPDGAFVNIVGSRDHDPWGGLVQL